MLVARASSYFTCSCPERSPWFCACDVLLRIGTSCTMAKAPRRVRVPQCWESAEHWCPAQQRGGVIISLCRLLPLSPSSDFPGSYDLRPSPTRKGTQLLWSPPLGLLIVLPAGPDPNRLHRGAAGGISLLALIIRCSLKRHGRAQRPPLTSVVLPLSTSLLLSFPLYVPEGVLPSPSSAPLLAALRGLICVCRPCHTSSTGLWNMHN